MTAYLPSPQQCQKQWRLLTHHCEYETCVLSETYPRNWTHVTKMQSKYPDVDLDYCWKMRHPGRDTICNSQRRDQRNGADEDFQRNECNSSVVLVVCRELCSISKLLGRRCLLSIIFLCDFFQSCTSILVERVTCNMMSVRQCSWSPSGSSDAHQSAHVNNLPSPTHMSWLQNVAFRALWLYFFSKEISV